jgi:hypothetical protein
MFSNWDGATPANLAVAPGASHTVALSFNGSGWLYDDAIQRGTPVPGGFISWGADAHTAVAEDTSSASDGNGNIHSFAVTPSGFTLTRETSGAWAVTLNPAQAGMTFQYVGGLLYSETGAVLNISAQEIGHTLPLATVAGADFGIGPLVVDQAHHRVYAAVCLVLPVNSGCGMRSKHLILQITPWWPPPRSRESTVGPIDCFK